MSHSGRGSCSRSVLLSGIYLSLVTADVGRSKVSFAPEAVADRSLPRSFSPISHKSLGTKAPASRPLVVVANASRLDSPIARATSNNTASTSQHYAVIRRVQQGEYYCAEAVQPDDEG